jgi:hypothetical protein
VAAARSRDRCTLFLTRKLGSGGRAAANLDLSGGKVAGQASVVRREDRDSGWRRLRGCGVRRGVKRRALRPSARVRVTSRKVRREWELEDLIECWTLDEADSRLIANKSGATRLGFALALKFFEQEARFPRYAGELPPAAVKFVSGQVKVDAAAFAGYSWSGRTAEYHRAQIRAALGFREPTVGDEDKLADWLAAELCPG